MKDKIIKDLHNGNPNGDGYTIKEILTAHIREDTRSYETLINEISILKRDYVQKRTLLFVLTGIASWLGWLTIQLWNFIKGGN